MRREFHVRFWESAGVRFPRATRLGLSPAEQAKPPPVREILRVAEYGDRATSAPEGEGLQYEAWASFEPGSWVVRKSEGKLAGADLAKADTPRTGPSRATGPRLLNPSSGRGLTPGIGPPVSGCRRRISPSAPSALAATFLRTDPPFAPVYRCAVCPHAEPPELLPSGYAALLCLYGLR